MGRILVEYSDQYNYYSNVTPHAADVTRTWVRNDVGTAEMTFPLTTPNLWGIIQWGRIVRIHEYGVPSWVGVATEREWTDAGVTLHLKSAEWLLQKSITGQGLAFPAGTRSGAIAYGLFASGYLVNRLYRPIRPGIFDGTKTRFKEPYNYADCWTELKNLADEDGADVWVDDKLYCHYRDMRGTDKRTTVKLREGLHLVNVKVSDSIEDTLTKAIALGKGDTIPAKPKLSTSYNGDLGYERAEVLNFDTVDNPDGLREPLFQAIRDRVYPKFTIDAEFIKVPSGAFWGQFFIGDIIEVLLTSYLDQSGKFQLNAPVRVLGMELGGEDRMRLVLEVIAPNYDIPFIAWQPTNAAI